jgi:hypothetical protein
MEKDEKLQQVHHRRTRTLVVLSAVACLMLMVGSVWMSKTTENNNTAVSSSSFSTSSIRQRHKPAPAASSETNLKNNHPQHVLSEQRHRKRDHYTPEDVLGHYPHEEPNKKGNHNDDEEHKQQQGHEEEEESEQVLVERVKQYDQHVRDIKQRIDEADKFMETDPEGMAATQRLQDVTRQLLHKRYGAIEPYRVQVDLEFQPSNPTFATQGKQDSIVIEMAPTALMPHAVFTFLEVARQWTGGAFHRRAAHVLQVMVKNRKAVQHLAFQEYSPEFPHTIGTVGYAGRPSGPAWYISLLDNTKNHGPGSQQKRNPYEADACFGKVVQGMDDVVRNRIAKMPGQGFLKPDLHVKIPKMTILIPSPDKDGTFVPWTPK